MMAVGEIIQRQIRAEDDAEEFGKPGDLFTRTRHLPVCLPVGAVCRGRAVEGTKYNQEAGSSQKRQKARGHDAAPPITGADEIGDVPEQQAREIERVARPEHD
jgi:hypothetical protein